MMPLVFVAMAGLLALGVPIAFTLGLASAIFYVLDEQKTERPVFERALLDCVQCHVAASTKGVPGVIGTREVYCLTGYRHRTRQCSFVAQPGYPCGLTSAQWLEGCAGL